MNSNELDYAFRMAEWRIERAQNHIEHLEKIIEWVIDPSRYGIFTEQNPQTGTYGIRVGPNSDGLPRHLPIVMGEVVHHLAVSLDYVWSGIGRSLGLAGENSRLHFPRHETKANLCDMVSKSPITSRMPDIGVLITETLRPYKDGNLALWAIGKLNNIDKHRLLLSTFAVSKFGKFIATADDGSIIDMSYSTINSSGPCITFGFDSPFKINEDAELTPLIVFNEPSCLPPGQPVLETLINFRQASIESLKKFKEFFADMDDGTSST